MSNERYNFNIEALTKLNFQLLYISTAKYEEDWQSLPHAHHFTELFYVISGQGNFLVDNDLFPVKESDLVIVNPHVEHTEQSRDNKPLEYIVFGVEGITFTFGESQLTKSYGYYNYSTEKNHLLDFSQILLKELNQKQSGYEAICHNLLEVLLIFISRNYELGILSSPSSRMSKECAIAKRYLDLNYSQNISLDSLALATHTNKYYLSHTFSKCLGISPINYLIQKRLQISKDLLTSTNYSIAQIASSTGFASQSYFSQIFKKFTNLSPNQYRKLNSSKLAEQDVKPVKSAQE